MTHLKNHARAADLLLNRTGDPSPTANGLAWPRAAHNPVAAWVTRIRNTLLNHGPRHRLGVGFPPAAAHRNGLRFRDRFHDRVAAVFVTGLCFRSEARVALIPVTGFVNRPTDFVAARSIARPETRLADRIAHITVACLVTRLSHVTCHRSPVSSYHRLADVALDAAIVRLKYRSADCVSLSSIARLVYVSRTGYRNRFCTAVIHNSVRCVLLLVPDDVSYRSVLDAATTLR